MKSYLNNHQGVVHRKLKLTLLDSLHPFKTFVIVDLWDLTQLEDLYSPLKLNHLR